MTANLLVEIGCEELPAQEIKKLAEALAVGLEDELHQNKIKYKNTKYYGTPRRLAVIVDGVATSLPEAKEQVLGPTLQHAFSENQPTPAAIGFAKKVGVEVNELEQNEERLVFNRIIPSKNTYDLLLPMIEIAVGKLPVSNKMRWGDGDAEFLRPVRWVQVQFNNEIVKGELFGVEISNKTYGHRFLCNEPILVTNTDKYVELLRNNYVLVDFEERRKAIEEQLMEAIYNAEQTKELNISLITTKDKYLAHKLEEIISELTGLVEWPEVALGQFDKKFLELPPEVLVTTMHKHQKYIPLWPKEFPISDDKFCLTDDAYKPSQYFALVSNIKLDTQQKNVVFGNNKVLKARFEDSLFYWQKDLDIGIDKMSLSGMMYHQQLGSMEDKYERILQIAENIAEKLKLSSFQFQDLIDACKLCKLDLSSNMVKEFGELQGIMGGNYALRANYDYEVCVAVKTHYLPQQQSDSLPGNELGQVIALADKIDQICGIAKLGTMPTGDKDPYALRRMALGICRIIVEKQLNIGLKELVKWAYDCQPNIEFADKTKKKKAQPYSIEKVVNFIERRFQSYMLNLARPIDLSVFEAVMAATFDKTSLRWKYVCMQKINEMFNIVKDYKNATEPKDEPNKILVIDGREKTLTVAKWWQILESFKRIARILKDFNEPIKQSCNTRLFIKEEEEEALFEKCKEVELNFKKFWKHYEEVNEENFNDFIFESIFEQLESLSEPVANFFDKVQVFTDDADIQKNRLRLLRRVKEAYLQIADFSKLAD